MLAKKTTIKYTNRILNKSFPLKIYKGIASINRSTNGIEKSTLSKRKDNNGSKIPIVRDSDRAAKIVIKTSDNVYFKL